MDNKQNFEYKDFIGIYDGFVDLELCYQLQDWFHLMHEQRMVITAKEETGITATNRKDKFLFMPQINATKCNSRLILNSLLIDFNVYTHNIKPIVSIV